MEYKKMIPRFVSIIPPNHTPSDIALSASVVIENLAINTVVGTLSTTDSDVGDTFVYTLVSGTGSTDNASFNISATALRTSAIFDYETKSSYSIRIRSTDHLGAYYEEAFTITITNVAEYYVDMTAGDDAKDGLTTANAWKTITKVNATSMAAGSRVRFKRGETWSGTVQLNPKAGVVYEDYGSGALPIIQHTTANTPAIRASNVSGFTLRNLNVKANAALCIEFGTWSSGADGEGCSYATISNCTIAGPIDIFGHHNLVEYCDINGSTNDGNSGDASSVGNGVIDKYQASHHNKVDHCTIHHFTRRGCWTRNRSHDNEFCYNDVHAIYGQTDPMGWNADGAYHLCYRMNVHHNTFSDVRGYSVQCENTFDSDVHHNRFTGYTGVTSVFAYNYTTSDSDAGYGNAGNLQYYDMNMRFYCNILTGGGATGQLRLSRCQGWHIYHNTFHLSGASGIAITGETSPTFTPTCEVYNNIITTPAANNRAITVQADNTTWWTCMSVDNNNIMYKAAMSDPYMEGGTFTKKTIAQYQAVSGNAAKATNSKITDPGYVNVGTLDLHITNAGSAYHAGKALEATLTDFDGVAFVTATPSCGCYEYV
jgi:hypothetical protein